MFETWILIVGLILWALQYLLAAMFLSLTPAQMRLDFPGQSILPLVWHGGIWFDFPLTFYLAWLAKQHPEWTWWQWSITLAVGFTASCFMHFQLYGPATLPNRDPSVIVTQESHAELGEITEVGFPHILFFGMMLALLLNEALFSKNPSQRELWITTIVVTALLFVGNHMVLGIIKKLFGVPIDYRGKPLQNAIGWLTILGGGGSAMAITIARGVYHLW